MSEPTGSLRPQDLPAVLSAHARDLYEDSRLVPLLRRLMAASCALTAAAGSSISIADPAAGRYTKVAERGTACGLGESFPLDEGLTGLVMAGRRPVVLASYRDVPTGHLLSSSRARDGAVAAVPIWWRGDVIGVNVVFAGCPHVFTTDEVDQLELLTQMVAPGIVTAAARDLGMSSLLGRGEPDQGPGARQAVVRCSSVAEVALGLTSLVTRASGRQGPRESVQVRVVRDQAALRLQVQNTDDRVAAWQDLVDDGCGTVRMVGTEDRDGRRGDSCSAAAPSSPFTTREHQVAVLLSRGMSDRAIADALVISPKTAEKHVGAVLRKTGASSRTAAVVRALERGWLRGG